MHHLPRDELRDRGPDDIGRPVDVGDDPWHLGTRESVGFDAEAEHDLVAVDGVHVEVEGDAGAARGLQPVEQRPGAVAQRVGGEGPDEGNHSLTRVLAGAEITRFTELSAHSAAAFEPLIYQARTAGLVRPGVNVDDVILAFSMAGGAMAANSATGRERLNERLRGLLHRTLFTPAA